MIFFAVIAGFFFVTTLALFGYSIDRKEHFDRKLSRVEDERDYYKREMYSAVDRFVEIEEMLAEANKQIDCLEKCEIPL